MMLMCREITRTHSLGFNKSCVKQNIWYIGLFLKPISKISRMSFPVIDASLPQSALVAVKVLWETDINIAAAH